MLEILNFPRIPLVGVMLFHAGRQIDRQTDRSDGGNRRFFAGCFVKPPKIYPTDTGWEYVDWICVAQ